MSKFMDWVDARFPATKMWEDHLSKYYAPKNFNFFYFFGSLALLVLVNQLVTGVWLTMSYTPSAEEAFASVEGIMRRRVRLDPAFASLHRRLGILHRGLHAHVPWLALRLIPKTPRAGVGVWHADLSGADGRGLHGLPAAMGSDVVLGRSGDHLAVRRDPGHRQRPDPVDSG